MDLLLDRAERQLDELVSRISRLEPLGDQPAAFGALDQDIIAELAQLREQQQTALLIDAEQREADELNTQINGTLLELANYRRELESAKASGVSGVDADAGAANPDGNPAKRPIDSQLLLNYATRITRFTQQAPGPADPMVLPWPAEDQLRKGMLATLAIQGEPEDVEAMGDVQMAEETEVRQERRPAGPAPPKKKINLDFDSDDD